MREKIHRYIYIFGLGVIAFFMPISEFLTNACIIMLSTNYLIEANFKQKIKTISKNKELLFFLLLFFIPLIWFFNSQNMEFALRDIKIRLPLLALPIIIASSKALTNKQFKTIVFLFIAGVLTSTLAGLLAYLGIYFELKSDNVRHYSVFISHITLSVMMSLAILLLTYFIIKRKFSKLIYYLIAIAIIFWLMLFFALIQGFTGLGVLIVTSICVLAYKMFTHKNKKIKILSFSVLILLIGSIAIYLSVRIKDFYTPSNPDIQLKECSIYGNPYVSDTTVYLLENGNFIYYNVCEKELRVAWNNRSLMNFDGYDAKGQLLLHTIVRYMASKGLDKDAEGFKELTDKDIVNIEAGHTNYRFVDKRGISQRVYNIIWQIDVYLKGVPPDGHSITQRFEFQKYGLILAKRNLLLGTGTGDLDDEYKAIYEEFDSKINIQNRHRAHNQFLTFYITFGIIGASFCMLAWFYPIFTNFRSRSPYFILFFLIASFSMFADDMLETSSAVVFISFFYSLFLWGIEQVKEKN